MHRGATVVFSSRHGHFAFNPTLSAPYRVYILREEVRALILPGKRAQALTPLPRLPRWLTCQSDKQNATQGRGISKLPLRTDRCVRAAPLCYVKYHVRSSNPRAKKVMIGAS